MNWDITGAVDPRGNLSLYANLYQRKGTETGFVVNEINSQAGPNDTLLSEQGMPANVVFGFSQANTPQSRFMRQAVDHDSLADYGLFGSNQTFAGATDAASVENAASAIAADRARVKRIIPKRIALDVGETFSYLETGNILQVKNSTVGFAPDGGFGIEASARILSVDYNDLSNNAPVNLEIL
jgi:hypothetical protein